MSEEQTVSDPTPTRKSRRLFWTLLVLTLIVAITPLAVIGYRWHRQMELIERIEATNLGFVRQSPVGFDWLRDLLGEDKIRGFDTVESVLLEGNNIHLEELSVFPGMTDLCLLNPSKRDAEEIRELSGFNSLESLSIWDASLDDEILAMIATLRQLKSAEIWMATDITDRGLKSISTMSTLEDLTLSVRNLTRERIEELKRRLPNCDLRAYRRLETRRFVIGFGHPLHEINPQPDFRINLPPSFSVPHSSSLPPSSEDRQ